jgi:tRNA-splicing ligase RtcB
MHKFDVKNYPPIYTWMEMDSPDEWETVEKMKSLSAVPWVFHHVAIMADGHVGYGPCVGAVIAMKEAISPSSVGVDIGCGMAAVKLTGITANELPNNLAELRTLLEERIPVGFNSHASVKKLAVALGTDLWSTFNTLDPRVQKLEGKAQSQCGTLGGGNHFIELCLDTDNHVWLMLHSGSRNIGKELAEIHINIAKNLTHNQSLEDKNYAVLLANTPEFKSYLHDLQWAQQYALVNRQVMLGLITGAIQHYFKERGQEIGYEEPILAHHNYVEYTEHFGEMVYVTRKGAINAEKGRMGIIPGSMGAKSYIVRGLGNPDSFNSAPHGAGRRMSRGAAKKKFTLDDLKEQTSGVECRKDRGVLDEIPGAYKPIQAVMDSSKDLVEMVTELKQILCIKG